MKIRRVSISTVIMTFLSFFIIYLLHDLSKDIVLLLCGGKLKFDHGIYIVNASTSNLFYILNLILGIAMPIIFLFFLVFLFNNSLRNGLYHKFTLIFFICSLLSISSYLIFYPLISLRTNINLNKELDELLSLTGISPLIILVFSLIIAALLMRIAYKKNLFKNL